MKKCRRPRAGTKGRFVFFGEEGGKQYKGLEDDFCLTHADPSVSTDMHAVTFRSDDGRPPKFDAMIVGAQRSHWWVTRIEG